MTGDETPEPVTKSDAALDRILAESAATADALDRLLAETATPPLDLEPLPTLDLADLPALDLPPLPDLSTVTDLVDLDRLLAETAVTPLEDATVVDLVAEVLGRD